MEKTVETLEAMFQKADSDLNYLSRKLEFEIENKANGKEQINPLKCIQKIGEIKKEYAAIVKEASAIQDAQKEAMDYFQSQLLTACQMLQKLNDRTGSEGMEQPDCIGQLEQLLGIDLSQTNSDSKPSSPLSVKEEGSSTDNSACSVNSTCKSSESSSRTSSSTANQTVSSVSRRKDSHECIEIDQAEFESVSSLVRGRVKLADVNVVYNRLWTHFKEEGNSAPLSTSEMYEMGWKITGSTGGAKLKVLRALKLLKISPKGEVSLT